MGRFGKKNEVNLNPLSYNITILGESGIGKTTIAKRMCEKLAGEDGYIHFDIGREFGSDAIEGIISERIEDWAKLIEVKDDIVENKVTDYPNLKAVIFDTFDELIILAETESLRQYNKGKDASKKADTINGSWGGFGKGQEYALGLILDVISDFRSVGVSTIIIGHVKRTDIIDPISQATYSKLTADTTQKYFNGIKNKQHFVALAYIDRDIVNEKTGRKNIVTQEDITVNKAVSESRIISFRDDTYSVDSKSRFADIVDRVPFDCDALIKAMTDAILAEHAKGSKSLEQTQKEQAEAAKIAAEKVSEISAKAKANKVNTDKNEELKAVIQSKFTSIDAETKARFKALMAELGVEGFKDVSTVPTASLEKLVSFFE